MYQVVRSLLFLLPAETAHYVSMNWLKAVCSFSPLRKLLTTVFKAPSTQNVRVFGIHFPNPVGLGAGFDKNAKYLRELKTLGFGFIEIGTVTPKPQPGNEKPRLFRLPKDKALINRMGFNNDGVAIVKERLKNWREAEKNNSGSARFIIGGNIGKNKITPNEEAWKDYEICFRELHPYVDFFVVNVSSPNTPGLRELQEKDALKKILTHLQEQNKSFDIQKPILLKIAPDLTLEQIDDVIDLAKEIRLDGLVATNTTIDRSGLETDVNEVEKIGAGGVSGKPVKGKSTYIVQHIYQKTGGSIPVIGSGGIFTAQDAQEKVNAGAELVEVWTGFIYEGPFIVRNICKGLQKV